MLNRELKETGDGGSIVIERKNINIDKGLFTDVYIALFSTVTPYWANNYFNIDINSQTEKVLNESSTDEQGLESIALAVQSDLSSLTYADFVVNVSLVGNDRININITANNNQTMQVVWDFTEKQIIQYNQI